MGKVGKQLLRIEVKKKKQEWEGDTNDIRGIYGQEWQNVMSNHIRKSAALNMKNCDGSHNFI